MSLKNHITVAKFPSSAIFDELQHALASSEKERRNAIEQANALLSFVLSNAAGETDSWHVDLRRTGRVGKGAGDNPTAVFLLSNEELGDLVSGRLSAETLFMAGKLRIKGDIVKTTVPEPLIKGPGSPKL
ncbi:hypothetical protein VUR80DRAFT_3971 [Thermomyces stellatus]